MNLLSTFNEPGGGDVRRSGSRVRFVAERSKEGWERRAADLRDDFVEASKRIARAEADRARALAALQQDVLEQCTEANDIDYLLRSRASECAAALGVSDRAVLAQMNDSHRLVHDFPVTFQSLGRAAMTLQHARVIMQEGLNLQPELRMRYEAEIVGLAETASPGRLRTKARAAADALQERTIDERHRAAALDRRVWVTDLPDGMAEIGAVLPAVLAYGIRDRLHRAAKAARRRLARSGEAASSGEGEAAGTSAGAGAGTSAGAGVGGRAWGAATATPSLDMLRADLFAHLLLTAVSATEATGRTGAPVSPDVMSEIVAHVQLTVPAVGGAARLDGYGPIDSETARWFASLAPGWDRIALSDDGELLATDRRQPTEAMRRILRARDAHCRFPGCFVPVDSCEIDHTVDWAAGGPTTVSNLGRLCPKHHLLKHPEISSAARWKVRQEADGTFLWTSPTGAQYPDPPERVFLATRPATGPAPPARE